MHDNTVLDLSSIPIPPGAGRGIAEDISDLGFGELARDVNNEAFALRAPGEDKFQVSYSGTGDWAAPAFMHLNRFDPVTVKVIKEWTHPVEAGVTSVTLPRTPADAAEVWVARADGTVLSAAYWNVSGRVVTFFAQDVRCFVLYRPLLHCLLDRISKDGREWDATVNWRLDLIEK